MSLFKDASLVITPNGVKAGKLYAIKPTDGAGDLDVVRNTTATRVNANGLIEVVPANVPRLDYSNGSCPSVLVEPQRTNLALSSEDFTNLTYWFPTNVTTTANTTISPDGTLNADTANFGVGANALNSGNTFAGNSDVTISVFAKAGSIAIFRIRESFYIGSSCVFNLTAKTAGAGGQIEEYPNGWFRCSFTYNLGVGQTNINWIFDSNAAAGTLFLWGAQAETGSYPTSYIPTVASAVTRNADVISKTGISDLIGQTEGTMFIDFYAKNNSTFQILTQLRNISGTAQIDLRWADGGLYALGNNNALNQFYLFVGSITVGFRYKIAIAYKLNDIIIYVNGVSVNSDNSATFLDQSMSYFSYAENLNNFVEAQDVNMSALFKTRLTNTKLATLTSL